LTLLGDAAHSMPPTLAQGTNQALLDTMVLRKALSDLPEGVDVSSALAGTRTPGGAGQGGVLGDDAAGVAQQSVLRPAALISDRS